MSRRIVYAIRPVRRVKGLYEGKVEYMPGYTKSFMGKNFAWIVAEIEKALDNKVPTLSGKIELKGEQND